MSSIWRINTPIILLTFVLDQWSKWWIEQALPMTQEWVILSFLSLQRTYNTGAAFGLLHDAGGWQRIFLSLVSIGIMIYLGYYLHRVNPAQRMLATSLALLLGGAAGNLLDRLHTGAVTDFIVLHYQHWVWPTFNIADAAITLGVIGLLLSLRRTNAPS